MTAFLLGLLVFLVAAAGCQRGPSPSASDEQAGTRTVTVYSSVVHDLDMKEAMYGPREAAAIGRVVDGLRVLHTGDATLLEHGIGVFDALAQSVESDEGGPSSPKSTRRGRRA